LFIFSLRLRVLAVKKSITFDVMKKILFIFFILISLSVKSQTTVYHPFPEDTATWISDYYDNICMGYCSSYFYEMKGDTIINSQSYNKIYSRYGHFYYISPPPNLIIGASFTPCSYTGAIKQDSINKKVYFIDSTMTTDTLLYDFNLAIGDTIQSWYNKFSIQWPMIVSGIDSVSINSNYHKLFNFTNFPPNMECSLIEGIGWSAGLFGGFYSNPQGDNPIVLACFDGNFGANLGWGGPAILSECSYALDCSISVNTNEQNGEKYFSLSPNPFSEKLNITSTNNKESEIILYDIFGRKILSQQLLSPNTELKTTNLSKGVYLYEVRNKDSLVKNGKVVKD
jgi:hypothetical protein